MDYIFKMMTEKDGRKPTLWIMKSGKIHAFKGDSIPDVVNVLSTKPEEEAGRVSITYMLQMWDGVTPCLLIASPHGRLWPDTDAEAAYNRFKKQFGAQVSKLVFKAALELHFPLTFERMLLGGWDPWSKKIVN